MSPSSCRGSERFIQCTKVTQRVCGRKKERKKRKKRKKERKERQERKERKERKKVKSLSHFQLFATPWTVAYQARPSMGFSRQEYWSGLPFPSPGDLPDPGIEPRSPALQADALPSEPPGKPRYVAEVGLNKTQDFGFLWCHCRPHPG